MCVTNLHFVALAVAVSAVVVVVNDDGTFVVVVV